MISVCVATYNGAEYIREQLNSILSQLTAEDEVIVSDGGSVDDTIARIEQLHDKRIRIILLPEFHTQASGIWKQVERISRNFENALQYAKGEIIFLSDQDDRWMPDKVARVLACMDRETMCVVHDAQVTDEQLHVMEPSIMKSFKPCFSRWGVLWKSPFMGCCMAVRKEVVDEALPVPQGVEYDTWLGCVARKKGNVRFVQQPLLLYRRHEHNASYLAHHNHNSLWVKLIRRYNILKSCVLYL